MARGSTGFERGVQPCVACGHESGPGARFCEACGAPLVSALRPETEHRKTVTVVFCDLVGSTSLGEALDPEALRALLARYFERMREIVERHGGSVEKFIGDAVMAVFGVPAVHEDDAVRALVAAVEMRDALPALGVKGRIGVTTGEVVTGTAERLATGDAVNVAARLQQAAGPGEILAGEPSVRFACEACEVEPVEPLDLRGKSLPVAAFRVLAVHGRPERRHGAAFVGRDRERELLLGAWRRVVDERRCELATVVGDAGVGKSRLGAELAVELDATVVRGRCLPYGEGITYWPIVEILRQLGVEPGDEHAAAAVRSLLGETAASSSADEIAWAFRKTLELAAAERPVVAVFDDVHWGEETFLDLLEHVSLLSSGAPLLLLCLARPELLDRRPSWPVTLHLEPLAAEDAATLIPARVAPALRGTILRAAGGNPLFIQEIVAMAEEGDGGLVVPPTLQALLAARLDQLDAAERAALERGAVEGEIFHRGAVQALAVGEEHVTPRLAALVRKQLIRPDRSQLAGEDAFRFCHLLMRDAAYTALPKATRAELHALFARWLGQHGGTLVELDEVVGYHLEQACRYRSELGLPADDDLRAGARARLTAAGVRARLRGDLPAAVSLLGRAAALVPQEETDLALEHDLVESLFWAGRGADALARARALRERAAASGNRAGELCGRIKEALLRTLLEPEGATEELAALVEQAVPELEQTADDVALLVAYHALVQVAAMRTRADEMLEAAERAAAYALAAGRPDELFGRRAAARYYGTTPVPELLAWLDEQEPAGGWSDPLDVRDSLRALALGMLGRFDEARSLLADLRARWSERGGGITLASALGHDSADVERWAGNPAATVELGAEALRLYEEMGEHSLMSTAAGKHAQALYELGRLDEAGRWADRAAELGASDDALTQMLWRQVRAKLLARAGAAAEAEQLAREAVAIAAEGDMLQAQGEAFADLAEVLELAGDATGAVRALEEAIERFERKGSAVSASRARARLAGRDVATGSRS